MSSRVLMLVIVVALLCPSCNGCNHVGGRDGGGGGGDLASGMECVSDPDCGSAAIRCCANVCVETASCALAVTSLSPARGFQNGGDFITLHGAGFAAGMKVYLADGRAPVRVLDAATALIETPPGPVGAQDVKIVVGGASAIRHHGFLYRSGALELQWEQKPLMTVRGEDPGLAVMQDGRVLVAGGTTVPDNASAALRTAEIYDRPSDTVTAVTSMMSAPRWQNSAVTLLTGKVLVVGGACAVNQMPACTADQTSADLFDPVSNSFTPTAMRLNQPRIYTRAVLMVDGRVFIASGNDATVEIYDPASDSFTLVPHAQAHVYGFVVRLRDGRVLLGGGDGGVTAAELYDTDSGSFTSANAMVQSRSMLTAHTLPDGRVAVVGGASNSAGGIVDPLASIEYFNPATNSFTAASYALATARCWHAAALVRDGTILVMGGYTLHNACSSSVATVEVLDPVAGKVTPFSTLLNTNTEWTAVTLLDGSVLGVGGGACNTSMALPDIDFLAGQPIP
jgi:hypothetical protein